MQVMRFYQPQEFLREALPLLIAREAENNLILGRTASFGEKPTPSGG